MKPDGKSKNMLKMGRRIAFGPNGRIKKWNRKGSNSNLNSNQAKKRLKPSRLKYVRWFSSLAELL